jgi:hypothetical protein
VLRQARGLKPAVQVAAAGTQVAAGSVRVPDMTGWPVREAVRRTAELGLNVKVVGTGLLARQTPAPNGVVQKGGDVVLVFEPAT